MKPMANVKLSGLAVFATVKVATAVDKIALEGTVETRILLCQRLTRGAKHYYGHSEFGETYILLAKG